MFFFVSSSRNSAARLKRRTIRIFAASGMGLLLSALLFGESSAESPGSVIGFIAAEIAIIIRRRGTQWLIFLVVGVYFVVLFLARCSCCYRTRPYAGSDVWLGGGMMAVTIVYLTDYQASTNAVTLLAGAVLGQGMIVCSWFAEDKRGHEMGRSLGELTVLLFLVLITAGALLGDNIIHESKYQGQVRWSGPWANPNNAGLLAGTAMAVALGAGFEVSIAAWQRSGKRRFVIAFLFLMTACLMVMELLESYSRGAWVATFIGAGYIIADFGVRSPELPIFQRIKRNWLPLAVGCVSLGVVLFWQFKQTNWRPARRALSAANSADFSWRNRIAAWEGALQVAADHPWFGVGWSQPELLYEYYYLPPRLTERGAIATNDYLMLGATLGIPALFCFCMYFWQSLFGRAGRVLWNAEGRRKNAEEEREKEARESDELDWLKTTCRAGAIVLAVGFWFDGGLFKLATASVFWILLELGSVAWGEGGRRAVSEKVCQ
jgi:O-antigen ligase